MFVLYISDTNHLSSAPPVVGTTSPELDGKGGVCWSVDTEDEVFDVIDALKVRDTTRVTLFERIGNAFHMHCSYIIS